MYAVTSTWLESLTRATLRRAEFGFFGVVVYTRVHTPRRCGLPFSAGVFVFVDFALRPLRTSCWIVGIRVSRLLVVAALVCRPPRSGVSPPAPPRGRSPGPTLTAPRATNVRARATTARARPGHEMQAYIPDASGSKSGCRRAAEDGPAQPYCARIVTATPLRVRNSATAPQTTPATATPRPAGRVCPGAAGGRVCRIPTTPRSPAPTASQPARMANAPLTHNPHPPGAPARPRHAPSSETTRDAIPATREPTAAPEVAVGGARIANPYGEPGTGSTRAGRCQASGGGGGGVHAGGPAGPADGGPPGGAAGPGAGTGGGTGDGVTGPGPGAGGGAPGARSGEAPASLWSC